MRRLMILAVAVVTAVVLVPLAPTTAGAGEAPTTDVYVVHGLNLNDQTSQDDGGAPVTVCIGVEGRGLFDFEFGDVAGPLPLPTGLAIPVLVYDGDEDCTDPSTDPIIDTLVTPEGEAMALVATAGPGANQEPGELELLPFELDLSCYEPGQGRVMGAHAAAAPPVELFLGDTPVDELAYGDSITAPLPAGDYEVSVVGGNTVLVDLDVTIVEGIFSAAFVVGNQPTFGGGRSPVVALALAIPLEPCEVPVDTTVTPTTAAPATTAAARPAAAQPRFTG